MALSNAHLKDMDFFRREKRTVRVLREVSAEDLDSLFQAATTEAIIDNMAQDVPLSGLNEAGRVIESYNPGSPQLDEEPAGTRSKLAVLAAHIDSESR